MKSAVVKMYVLQLVWDTSCLLFDTGGNKKGENQISLAGLRRPELIGRTSFSLVCICNMSNGKPDVPGETVCNLRAFAYLPKSS